jgi:ribosomal protein S18 acetylase RimI-like enzyme
MRPDEIDLVIDWAAHEGWNPGLDDAVSFAAADSQGFLIGLLDGQPAAAISAVRYGAGFAFVGCYIVAPQFRGRGFGRSIWQAAMDRLEGRNVGLDGVVAQQENYRRYGFCLAHRNVRFAGKAGQISDTLPVTTSIETIGSEVFADVVRYDRRFFADDRSVFLRAWIAQPRAKGLVVRQAGTIVGYGLLRPCRQGYKFGPLFADAPLFAEALFVRLGEAVPAGSEVYLDVPAINPDAISLAERLGLTPVFETARMYIRSEPTISIDRTYGITTFELG